MQTIRELVEQTIKNPKKIKFDPSKKDAFINMLVKKTCKDCGTELDVFGCILCDGRLP